MFCFTDINWIRVLEKKCFAYVLLTQNDEFVSLSSVLQLNGFWINFELVAEFEQMCALNRAATVIGGHKNNTRVQCFVPCNNKLRTDRNFQS